MADVSKDLQLIYELANGKNHTLTLSLIHIWYRQQRRTGRKYRARDTERRRLSGNGGLS